MADYTVGRRHELHNIIFLGTFQGGQQANVANCSSNRVQEPLYSWERDD